MLRSEIEDRLGNYLNREGDPVVTDVAPFWFRNAHNAIQRLRNWKAQETTGNETLHTDVDHVCAPLDIKEGFVLYSYDPIRRQVLNFYDQVDIGTIRDRRTGIFRDPLFTNISMVRDVFSPNLFAIWANEIELYPKPGPELNEKELRWDYYRWVCVPPLDGHDWFTDYAGDYLLYRMLTESVPFLDSTDGRLATWAAMLKEAEAAVLGVDVSATWASSSLQMRG
jgi:hypothetical protein